MDEGESSPLSPAGEWGCRSPAPVEQQHLVGDHLQRFCQHPTFGKFFHFACCLYCSMLQPALRASRPRFRQDKCGTGSVGKSRGWNKCDVEQASILCTMNLTETGIWAVNDYTRNSVHRQRIRIRRTMTDGGDLKFAPGNLSCFLGNGMWSSWPRPLSSLLTRFSVADNNVSLPGGRRGDLIAKRD